MKRAIYVGEPEDYPYAYPPRHPLRYGMTGEVHDSPKLNQMDLYGFFADGRTGKEGSFVNRADIYIPSEDATRHCPKQEAKLHFVSGPSQVEVNKNYRKPRRTT